MMSLTIYGFTFLLAFCSLFYEFAFAQILSVSIGGTKIQYLVIISLFTFALGLGSLAFSRVKNAYSTRVIFFRVEVLLTILGMAGPFAITGLLRPDVFPDLFLMKVIISYLTVFLIGFLSGFEVPCLFAMSGEGRGKILGVDYLGMLVASVAFPLFFLPQLGTAPSVMSVAALNAYALIWLRADRPRKDVTIILSVLVTLFIAWTLLHRAELNSYLSQLYLGGVS